MSSGWPNTSVSHTAEAAHAYANMPHIEGKQASGLQLRLHERLERPAHSGKECSSEQNKIKSEHLSSDGR